MTYDRRVFRGSQDAIGAPGDDAAVNSTDDNTLVSLLKGLYALTSSSDISPASIGTQTTVGDTASSTTILALNASRKGASIYNDSSAALYLLLSDATASASAFTVKLAQDDYFEAPSRYTGKIVGIWASDAGGNARVTEWT